MNKRIEELAVSSGIYDSLCDPYDALKNGDYYSSIKVDLEKFAELIVKECAKVLTQHGAYFSGQGEPYHYAASLIEEHFGVEE